MFLDHASTSEDLVSLLGANEGIMDLFVHGSNSNMLTQKSYDLVYNKLKELSQDEIGKIPSV